MMNLTKKILVTGASGFIGFHLTRKLVKEGFRVAIITRRTSDIWRIKDFVEEVISYNLDLQDTAGVIRVVTDFKPEVIFHLAAYYAVEHKKEEIPSMIGTNVLGIANMLQAAKEANVDLFVNTSTCFVYKQGPKRINEESEVEPLNFYALTKIQSEQLCDFYSEKYGLRAVTFRLFPPYGSADNERRLIPYVIRNFYRGIPLKLSTGKQQWDFIYVEDIIEAYFRLLNVKEAVKKHEIFNIGSGEAISVRQVVSRIKEIMGAEIEPEWGAIPNRRNELWHACANISKARKHLGWKPEVQILKDGARLTVDWFIRFWENKRGG